MYKQIKWNLAGILGKLQGYWRRLPRITGSMYTTVFNLNIFAYLAFNYRITQLRRVHLGKKVSNFIMHSRSATKGNQEFVKILVRPFCVLQIL